MRRALAVVLAIAATLGGCASVPTNGAATPNPADPWESFNRQVSAFNDAVDDVVRPVAQAYVDSVPQLVRTGVSNVFGNIGDAWSTLNQFLQGKIQFGLEMGMRVLTNSFFGIGGLLDPATEMGLIRRSEDLGQTLGRWGVGPGPYLVVPIFGPRTLRDASALIVDRYYSAPWRVITDTTGPYIAITTLELVDARANLLFATQMIGDVALDRYSFVRDSYLARRLDQVYDGAPPLEVFDTEPDSAPPPK